jgi:hypothetical protein
MRKASKRKVLRRVDTALEGVAERAEATKHEMRWADIVREVSALEEQWLANGSMAWYRGHAAATWNLKSTLHREVEAFVDLMKTPPPLADQVDLLRKEYKKEYRRFRSRAWPLLDQRERSDWGIVFAMQHYGQITRLLDWSESFACAVYFALVVSRETCQNPNQNMAVWMLDPQALNVESQGLDGLIALDEEVERADGAVFDARSWHPKYKPPADGLRSIAIAPDFTNPRMTAQRAAFTMSGDSFEPLDKEFPNLVASGRLRKFVLSPALKKQAAAFLAASGLDAYSFFPDLQGLAVRRKEEVRKRFEIMRKFYGSAMK